MQFSINFILYIFNVILRSYKHKDDARSQPVSLAVPGPSRYTSTPGPSAMDVHTPSVSGVSGPESSDDRFIIYTNEMHAFFEQMSLYYFNFYRI